MKIFFLYIVFMLSVASVFGQDNKNCKVVNDELNGNYKGQCLDGMANGKGDFTFANGAYVYVGHFRKGKMDGKGEIFSVTNRKRTSVTKGTWENNVFVGNESVPYEVNRNINLDRYTVSKKDSNGRTVKINFYQNGNRNNISNLNVAVNNGNRISDRYTEGFENIIFPFTCQVTYNTLNKLNTSTFTVSFNVVINEPGSWEIFLYN